MKFLFLTLALALPLFALMADAQTDAQTSVAPPEKIALWPEQAPIGDGQWEKANPTITIYRPQKANGAAAIICPGGGYGGLVMGAEGSGIAQWLNAHGITGIVLEYRLPKGRFMVPLLDAQRAIRMARSNAKIWGLDANRIGIIGFSAGGHLASTAATHFDDGEANSADVVQRVSSRPDFAILVYPVIAMTGEHTNLGTKNNLMGPNPAPETALLFSNDKQVSARTAPTYLAHAVNDKVVTIENSRMFFAALQAHKVPAQLLELPEGDHGLNGYKGPMWDAWQSGSMQWLASLKIIGAADALPNALPNSAVAQAPLKAEPGAVKETPQADPMKPIEDKPNLLRVLLIGDSISIGYTLPVRELLKGKANVHRILTNGAATKDGLAKLKTWLGDKKWDVIHFNWGLHDIKFVDDKQNVPIADYEKNLRELVSQLKATGAKLIWCSTTPVPDAKQNPMRKTADVLEYNAVAQKIMDENGVAIDDLYAFALPQIEKIQQKANVHFTGKGSSELAKQVASSIEAALPIKENK